MQTIFGFKDDMVSLEERVSALENGGLDLPITQKGDLVTRTISTNVRLGVGLSDNQVLTVDSITPTGLNWKSVDHNNLLNKGSFDHSVIDSHIITNSAHGVTGVIVGTTDSQVLSNKTLVAGVSGLAIRNNSNAAINTLILPSGSSGNTTLVTNQSTNRTINFPDSDGTVALTSQVVNSSGYLNLNSGINVTLNNPIPIFIHVTNAGGGFNIFLPQMNVSNSLKVSPNGCFFIYSDIGASSTSFSVVANDTVTNLYVVRSGVLVMVTVSSNASNNGSFIFTEITTNTGIQTLTRKTISSGVFTNWTTDNTADVIGLTVTNTIAKRTNIVDTSSSQTLSSKTIASGVFTGSSLDNTASVLALTASNTLATRNNIVDTTSSQTLSSKTINTLTTTGTSSSFYSGKVLRNYVTSTTINAVTNIILAVAIPVNTTIIVDCKISGFCTVSSGANTGKYVTYDASFAGANNAGVAVSATIATANSRSGAFGGAVFSAVLSGTTINLSVTGVNNDTIVWSGEIVTILQ